MTEIVSSDDLRGYRVRTYRGGDEGEFVRLFNVAYGDYAGFVPRKVEYWGWCCKSRPGVDSEGVFVVEKGDEIVGYGVVGKSGEVYELCYDPSCDGRAVVSVLLGGIVDYVDRRGGDSVMLYAPGGDPIFRDVCEEMGFAATHPPSTFQLSVIDFPRLLRAIIASRRETIQGIIGGGNEEVFLIRLEKAPPWCESRITLSIRGGEIFVSPGRGEEPNVTVSTDVLTMTSCIFGKTGAFKAILTSRIRVRPFWKIWRAVELFSLLRLGDPWYVPLADYG